MNKGEIRIKSIFKRILSLMIINIMLISLFAPYSKAVEDSEKLYNENVQFSLKGEDGEETFTGSSIEPGGYVYVYMYITANRPVNGIDGYFQIDEQFKPISSSDIELNRFYTVPEGCLNEKKQLGGEDPYYQDYDGGFSLRTGLDCHNSEYSTYIARIKLYAKDDIPAITSFEIGVTDASIFFTDSIEPIQTDGHIFSNLIELTPEVKSTFNVDFHYYNGKEETYETKEVNLYNEETSKTIQTPTLTNSYDSSAEGEEPKIWERIGWTTEKTAPITTATMEPTSTIITEGTKIEVSESADYYMLYKRNISVSYNANGGEETSVPGAQTGIVSTNTFNVENITGAELVMPTTKPTRVGYEFVSWNTKADGTGTTYEKSTTAEAKTGTFTDDTTLYARWTERGDTEYTIEYYKEEGTNEEGQPNYVKDVDATQTPTGTTGAEVSVYNEDNTIKEEFLNKFPGYTLDLDVEGTEESGNIAADGSLVLKLYYTAEEVDYTVEHYFQELDEEDNPYYDEENPDEEAKTGKTGNTISAQTEKSEAMEGYTIDTAKSDAPKKIQADGTTVLKIYYKANTDTEYTVNHYLQQPTTEEEEAEPYALATENGTQTLTGTTGKLLNFTSLKQTFEGYELNLEYTQLEYEEMNGEVAPKILGDGSTQINLYYDAKGDTPYQVKHYKEKVAEDGTTYYTDGTEETADEPDATDDLTGALNFPVYASAKTYAGYTVDETKGILSGIVINPEAGEGLVLKVYYKADSVPYTVKHYVQKVKEDGTTLYYADGENGEENIPDAIEDLTGKMSQQVTATSKESEYLGYELDEDKSTQTGEITIDERGENTLVLKLYYKARTDTTKQVLHIRQKPDGTYDTFSYGSPITEYMEQETLTGTTGTKAIAEPRTYPGYTFDEEKSTTQGWFRAEDGGSILELYYTANTNTPYKVEHYKQKNDGSYEEIEAEASEYKEIEEGTKETTGTTGAMASATARIYEGYIEDREHANRIVSAKIKGDGTTVLRLYYKKAITVVYDTKGGNLPEGVENPKPYNHGESYGELPTPTKEGYNFVGWYKTEEDLSNPEAVKLTNDDIVTASHTIYAKWEEKVYDVTLDFNGGTLVNAEGQPVVGEDGNPITTQVLKINHFGQYTGLPTLTPPEGREFKGWVNALEDYETEIITVQNGDELITKANHTLYADWQSQKHTVKFMGRNEKGEWVELARVKVPHEQDVSTQLCEEQGVDLAQVRKDVNTPQYFYKFTGWEDSKLRNVTQDQEVQLSYSRTVNRYTVTFYDEDKETKLDEKTVDYGDPVSTEVAPTKEADETNTYRFEKWVDAEGNTDDLSNVVANRNVYAYYKPTYIDYTITFVDDDDTQISTKADYHYGDKITTPEAPEKEATVQYTYTFAGWYDIEDENQTIVNFEDEENQVTVAKNTTYKAKYTQTLNKYKITYYNEKIEGVEPEKIAELETEYGKPANEPETPTKPDKDGKCYEFAGWVDEEGNPADLSEVTGEKVVYATYTQDWIHYTITYEGTMGEENPNPDSYTINDSNILLLPLSNRIGMKFAGWYTDNSYETPIERIITGNMANITIYAKWDIDKLMYFVKDTADVDNNDLDEETEIYDNFEDAKAYVDNQFDNGNGKAQGIYDLNNDLVYYPQIETKLYYVKENETIDNEDAIEYNDFDVAKEYVDNLFKEGTTTRIYDQNNDLVYEPKEDLPAIQYFVKENADDPNTEENTFDKFSESKVKADELFEAGNKVKVYDINGEIVYEPQGKDEEDKLYLKSTIYKIGENTPNEYDEGDELIYKVRPNTKLSDFIKEENLQTNGTIVVYKKDGKTPVGEEELIGTGMILKDTKGEEEIILPISVIGDTSGDGIVETDDLADTVLGVLGDITFTKLQFKAIDMAENGKIEADDLADEIKLVLGENLWK